MPRKSRTPVNPAALATRLADNRSLWQGLIRYDAASRYYARLAAEPGYEAWLLTWLPGQGTDWHDHGGSAGAFLVLQGTLTEEQAAVRPDGPPPRPPLASPGQAPPVSAESRGRPAGRPHGRAARRYAPPRSVRADAPACTHGRARKFPRTARRTCRSRLA